MKHHVRYREQLTLCRQVLCNISIQFTPLQVLYPKKAYIGYFLGVYLCLLRRRESGIEGIFRLDSPATSERIRMACVDQFTEQVSLAMISSLFV